MLSIWSRPGSRTRQHCPHRPQTPAENRQSLPTRNRIDRTVKLYIEASKPAPIPATAWKSAAQGCELLGEAGLGNRKRCSHAVEAARKASGWGKATATTAPQVFTTSPKISPKRRDEIPTAWPPRRRSHKRRRGHHQYRAHSSPTPLGPIISTVQSTTLHFATSPSP